MNKNCESNFIQRVIKGGKIFENDKGRIANYELPEKINWIGLISSKKGTARANHYHPIQEQKTLLISGSYVSVFKDLGKEGSTIETCLIEAGDLEIIRPNVAHTMVFLEDSILINLVNGEREHENFGKHTIPYELVNQANIKEYLRNKSK